MATVNGQTKAKSKYLYTAYFADGTKIEQDEKDCSKLCPPVIDENGDPQGKSQFYDVLEYQKISDLVKFELSSTGGIFNVLKDKISVNLQTGLFSINGFEFNNVNESFELTEKLRLIYQKISRIEMDLKKEVGKKDEVLGERHYVYGYLLGWQTTSNGKNYQSTIFIR